MKRQYQKKKKKLRDTAEWTSELLHGDVIRSVERDRVSKQKVTSTFDVLVPLD